MKTKHSIILFSIALLCMSAYSLAESIIAQLGMNHQNAQIAILANIVGRHQTGPMDDFPSDPFRVPYAKLLPSVIAGDKVTSAKELCDYVKNYVNSEKFLKDYRNAKEDALPLKVNGYGNGVSTLRWNLTIYEKNIKNYPNDTKYVAEQTVLMDRDQRHLDSLLEASKKPFPGKERWEKTYPEDIKLVVKKRLEAYLALVATVDFNATLTEPDKYKIRKFTNPAYEKKSPEWKAIYRAGKEVTQVVTEFVKEWLKGEIISSTKTTIPTDEDAKKQAAATNPAVAANSGAEDTSQPENSTPADNETDVVQPAKAKKSLLGKLKDKAKAIIKD
jgi:hypothetical protein